MGFFQNLFGKKRETRAEGFKQKYPKRSDAAFCRFLIVDPVGGRPKPGPTRPKKADCHVFEVYRSGVVGCVASFESPGAFRFTPLSRNLHLISHQWNPASIHLHNRPVGEGFEKVGELELEGFVMAQQSTKESSGALVLSDLKLRTYHCEDQVAKCKPPIMNCSPKTSLAYQAQGDRLWIAGGALSKVDSISEGDGEPEEVLEDLDYDGICLAGHNLFLKARRRNARMNDVVVIDHFKVSEDGQLEKITTLDQLYGPRTFDVHPDGTFLYAGGWTTDPYVRCFRLTEEGSELVGEVKVEIDNPFDQLVYYEPNILLGKTEKKLFVFKVENDGAVAQTTELEQCCVSLLD